MKFMHFQQPHACEMLITIRMAPWNSMHAFGPSLPLHFILLHAFFNLSPSLLYLGIDIFVMNGLGYQPLNGISSLPLSCLFTSHLSLFSWYGRHVQWKRLMPRDWVGFWRRKRQRRQDAAAGGEQCVLMVVGEPHPHQAVQMARQSPPRYSSTFPIP